MSRVSPEHSSSILIYLIDRHWHKQEIVLNIKISPNILNIPFVEVEKIWKKIFELRIHSTDRADLDKMSNCN